MIGVAVCIHTIKNGDDAPLERVTTAIFCSTGTLHETESGWIGVERSERPSVDQADEYAAGSFIGFGIYVSFGDVRCQAVQGPLDGDVIVFDVAFTRPSGDVSRRESVEFVQASGPDEFAARVVFDGGDRLGASAVCGVDVGLIN